MSKIKRLHFQADIRLSNSEMQDGEDLADCLRNVADRLGGPHSLSQGGTFWDVNGNKVGTWAIVEVES